MRIPRFVLWLIACLASVPQLSRGQASTGQGEAASQYPIADKVADKIIQKYQTSSCDELKAKKEQPAPAQKEEMEEKVVEVLKKNPDMRKHFLDKIAGPIANKMFECGMVP